MNYNEIKRTKQNQKLYPIIKLRVGDNNNYEAFRLCQFFINFNVKYAMQRNEDHNALDNFQ